jgi:hypothetical protein
MNKTKDTTLSEALIDLEAVKGFMKTNSTAIVEDALKSSLNKLLTEAEDYEEEEESSIEDNNGVEDTESQTDELVDDETADNTNTEEVPELDMDMDSIDTEGDTEEESGEEEEFDLEQFKDADGEYDLTNADTEQLIKVFKRIDNQDDVVVTDMGDGKIELEDGDTGAEYVIDTDNEEDPTIEIDLEDDPNISENVETEDFVAPDAEGEGMVDEKNLTQSYGTNRRAGVLSQTRAQYAPGQNKRNGAQLVGESSRIKAIKTAYEKKLKEQNSKHEAFKSSTNREMVQLKEALGQFSRAIKESAVVNNNLGKFVKLMVENTTTKEEKSNIIHRFISEAKSIETGNKLYESIKSELEGKAIKMSSIDKQFSAEGTKSINEQVLYQSPEHQNMLDLMRKVNNI